MAYIRGEKVDLRAKREKKLKEIIDFAYKNSPAFRKRMDNAGLTPLEIKTIDDLEKIPVIRKENLVEIQAQDPPFGRLLAVPPSSLKRIFQSPGPIYDPQGEEKDYWNWKEPLEAAGFTPDDVVINTFSYHLSPAGIMFDEGLRALGATVVPTGVGNTELQVRIINDLRATGFIGTPSFLMILLKKSKELGTKFPIKKAFVTAEPFTLSQRKTFEENGITVFQGYGTADVGAIAFECEYREGMHVIENIIIEIVDPSTGKALPPGEIGEVVVTLFNKTYPLIRFGTGDLSKSLPEKCKCGRETERIAGFMGRIGDAVKVRGMFVHPGQIQGVLKRYEILGDFIAEVTREAERDFLFLKVEAKNKEEAKKIRDELLEKLRDVLRVRVDRLEFVSLNSLKSEKKIIDKREWK